MFKSGNLKKQDCEEPTIKKIKSLINTLKNNRSPEEDDIESKLIKNEGKNGYMVMEVNSEGLDDRKNARRMKESGNLPNI